MRDDRELPRLSGDHVLYGHPEQDRPQRHPTPERTLVWSTSNATTCSLDNGAGPVSVDCNGNTSVGPAASTTYTLSASGAGGGPVQEQLSIEVEYCYPFTFTGTSGMSCPSGASEFCLTEPIVATSSAHAEEACRTCSANTCFQAGICDGAAHVGSGGLFFYADVTSAACGSGDLPRAGENWNGNRTVRFGHWAPVPTP